MSDTTTRTVSDPARRGLDPVEVCTLPADDLGDRIAWVQREILPHACETRRIHDGLAVELEDTADVREKVDRLIEMERVCCGGIAYAVAASATAGRLRLEIHGVDPDASVFRTLADRTEAPSLGGRIAKAAGGGVLMGFVVCCVLPVGAVALLGAAATPLTRLDAPGPILGTAAVAAVALWWWMGHRRLGRERAAPSCGPDC